MQSIVFVNTTTSKCRARITGIDLPRVHAKLESDLQVTVKFFADGQVPALLSSPTFRVAFKATPTGAILDMVTAAPEELADGYVFDFDKVTSPALLAAIGDTKLFECTFEVEWTIDGEVARAACPATIENAFIRAADSAPNPADPEYEIWLRDRAVRYDEEQTLTNEEKAQARANIGVGEGGEVGGVTDHGALTGLADDDHPQYHNNARGDARYAGISHTHAQSEVTGLEAALAGKAASSHTHAQSEVTGLEAALAGKAATSHTHAQSEVTGLEASLAGKAASSHTHAQSEVTGLEAALAGKVAASHTHAQSEVTGLEAALAGKAASSHTHAQSEVTGLVDALAGKAAASAGVPSGGTNGQYLRIVFDDPNFIPAWATPDPQPYELTVACSDMVTPLTTGAAKITFRLPVGFLLTAVYATVATAPTGSDIIIDINVGGASIFDGTDKLQIAAGQEEDDEGYIFHTSSSTYSKGQKITIDLDQVGSSTAGLGLMVSFIGERV